MEYLFYIIQNFSYDLLVNICKFNLIIEGKLSWVHASDISITVYLDSILNLLFIHRIYIYDNSEIHSILFWQIKLSCLV